MLLPTILSSFFINFSSVLVLIQNKKTITISKKTLLIPFLYPKFEIKGCQKILTWTVFAVPNIFAFLN